MIGGQLAAGKDQVRTQNIPGAQGGKQAVAALNKNVGDVDFARKKNAKAADSLLRLDQTDILPIFLNLPVRQNAACDNLLRKITKQLRLFQLLQTNVHEMRLRLP